MFYLGEESSRLIAAAWILRYAQNDNQFKD